MPTRKWTDEIDKITELFSSEFGKLSAEELNRKPDAQTWSIAQNIEHLILINQSYEPVIAALREGSYKLPFAGKMGFVVRFFGKMILNSVQPDRRTKMKTFAMWEPAQSDVPADIVQRFVRHQSELKKLITDSKDLIAKGTVISSPASRNVVYKLETAFDILVAHERRHFEQAREVRDKVGV